MKTYKRELAVGLLVWLIYIVETKDASIIEVLVWPIFTFAALAFGMDWFGKSDSLQRQSPQSFNRRGSERSSEYPTGSGEQSDFRGE